MGCMNDEIIGIGMGALPLILAIGNWLLSLSLASKEPNYFTADLKQLWPDSLPFLKAQWPFLLLCMLAASSSLLTAQVSMMPSLIVSTGIAPIVKIFYICYLAAPKYPGRLATIGAWSVITYIICHSIISTIGTLALFLFAVPGLILLARTCLFLPIFALEGYHPLAAVAQSWRLTSGKYWLVSRYLGIPMILFASLIFIPLVLTTVMEFSLHWNSSSQVIRAFSGSAELLLSITLGGLAYKLYDRLKSTDDVTKMA